MLMSPVILKPAHVLVCHSRHNDRRSSCAMPSTCLCAHHVFPRKGLTSSHFISEQAATAGPAAADEGRSGREEVPFCAVRGAALRQRGLPR